MERELKEFQERNIDPTKLSDLIGELLQESSEYKIDCLDLRDDLVRVVLEWFAEKKDELAKDFLTFYPQAQPASQELINRMRPVLSLDRIHAEGVEPEFRRDKIVDHWAGEIYIKILAKVFKV